MKYRHLRNATALLTYGEHRLLVDPMLADAGALPGFKFGAGRRPNPLVPLPADAPAWLDAATGVLVTHEHPDHLDGAALRWIRARGLPVWCSHVDAASLRRKGLDVREVHGGALGLDVEVIPARHGRGWLAWLMGPVSGYYLAHPDEPSVYLTSDAVLADAVFEAIDRLRPDVVVAPAGAADMGVGRILFSVDELVALVRRAPGRVVLNHLEALDHCPTTRAGLRERLRAEGLLARVDVPEDGEELHLARTDDRPRPRPRVGPGPRPGLQKWLTAHLAAT
ncbi:L-ascorbate metabolism protein UlaG, beta-lactamase superfamily [Nannocystis exedens]|uniref:L-ascorbate metabolism protein UlaG, beta-lactamase superfamily n=1 Tax=Nannocystis exedens TaxID=54 RepID=A0A1I2CEB2_9BACT|nr:MBL fold metallo-hydrolase [Nannocystis exedens]SFE66522.1 L-ascorbate metabolism protein UlaG, beta-lactamase superfamily [Nannocystis exedens]